MKSVLTNTSLSLNIFAFGSGFSLRETFVCLFLVTQQFSVLTIFLQVLFLDFSSEVKVPVKSNT